MQINSADFLKFKGPMADTKEAMRFFMENYAKKVQRQMEQNPGWKLQNAPQFRTYFYDLFLPKPRPDDIDNFYFKQESKVVTDQAIHFDNVQALI